MIRRMPAVVAVLSIVGGAALAQPATEVNVERGLMKDRPYTVIFPRSMESIPAGADAVVVLSQTGLQCDLRITPAAAGATTPNLASFRPASAVEEQRQAFPDFELTGQAAMGAFQSGPALIYSGRMSGFDKSPLSVVHAEAIDQGRRYVFECMGASQGFDTHRPLIRFLIANISTRGDGKCCVQPPAGAR